LWKKENQIISREEEVKLKALERKSKLVYEQAWRNYLAKNFQSGYLSLWHIAYLLLTLLLAILARIAVVYRGRSPFLVAEQKRLQN